MSKLQHQRENYETESRVSECVCVCEMNETRGRWTGRYAAVTRRL